VPGGVAPLAWTFFLGWVCLAWTGWETWALSRKLFPDPGWLAPVSMALVLFEWHLAWAAGSGMETLLFTALSLATLRSTLCDRPGWRTGVLAGLLAAT